MSARMHELGLSYRALAERTRTVDPDHRGLHFAYLNQIVTRQAVPAPQVMEIVAAALELDPTAFVEYRLALMRDLFDEQALGVDLAARHLEAVRELIAAAGADALPATLDLLVRALKLDAPKGKPQPPPATIHPPGLVLPRLKGRGGRGGARE